MRDLCTSGDVYITMADVKAKDSLLMYNEEPTKGTASTAFFVLHCKFPKPARGNFV